MSTENQATTHTNPNTVHTSNEVDITELTWPQRLQLVNVYSLSEKRAATLFKCSAATLKKMSTQHSIDKEYDCSAFATVITTQRRGRKSSNIQTAYDAVKDEPQVLVDFCTTHGVSINTISQCSRFNRTDVKISTINGVRMIYSTDSPLVVSKKTEVAKNIVAEAINTDIV